MLALLTVCARLMFMELRRHVPVLFGVVVLAMILDIRWMPTLIYLGVVWLLTSQVFTFRIRERQEDWESFLFTLCGRDARLFPAYLYVLSSLATVAASAIGVGVLAALFLLKGLPLADLDYASFVQISIGLLFVNQLQLLIAEVLPVNQIVLIQRLSLVVVLVGARLFTEIGLTGGSSVLWLLSASAAIFALGGVIPLARMAARVRAARL